MIVGIDVSTSAVDLVLLAEEDGRAEWHRISTPDDVWLNAQLMRSRMPSRSWWDDCGVWLVGIEDPHTRFLKSAKKLGIAFGAVAACLPTDLTVIPMPPQEWKRESVGKANASKEEVSAWALANWHMEHLPLSPLVYDATDAFAIAWAARALNEKGVQAAETARA